MRQTVFPDARVRSPLLNPSRAIFNTVNRKYCVKIDAKLRNKQK